MQVRRRSHVEAQKQIKLAHNDALDVHASKVTEINAHNKEQKKEHQKMVKANSEFYAEQAKVYERMNKIYENQLETRASLISDNEKRKQHNAELKGKLITKLKDSVGINTALPLHEIPPTPIPPTKFEEPETAEFKPLELPPEPEYDIKSVDRVYDVQEVGKTTKVKTQWGIAYATPGTFILSNSDEGEFIVHEDDLKSQFVEVK